MLSQSDIFKSKGYNVPTFVFDADGKKIEVSDPVLRFTIEEKNKLIELLLCRLKRGRTKNRALRIKKSSMPWLQLDTSAPKSKALHRSMWQAFVLHNMVLYKWFPSNWVVFLYVKVVGGMTWCIDTADIDLDVDLLFEDSLTTGQKMWADIP